LDGEPPERACEVGPPLRIRSNDQAFLNIDKPRASPELDDIESLWSLGERERLGGA